MAHLRPYLIFPGTCKDALDFFCRCFGEQISMLQRFSEAPVNFPDESAERVFHSEFRADHIVFMASDAPASQDLTTGTNVALFVSFSNGAEQQRVFAALAEDGQVLMPLNGGFGMLVDRFDVRWMLAHDEGG